MKLIDIKNSLNEISAIGGLKQVVKGNTDRVEGIKLSKEMAQAMIDWFNSSPYGRKYPNAKKGRLNLSLGIMGHFGLDRYAKHKGAKEELKYIKTLSKAMRDNVNESPVSLNKAEMEKLHKDGEIEKDGHEIKFTKEEKVNEDDFMMKKSIAKKYGDTSSKTPEGKLLNKAKSYKDFTKWISKYKKYIGKTYLKDILRDLKDLKDLEADYERADDAGNSYNEKEELNYARQELYTAIRLSMGYKESVNEGKYDGVLDKIEDLVSKAKSFMDVGNQLKKQKIKYSFSTSIMPIYRLDKLPIAIVNKRYAKPNTAAGDRVVGDMVIGLMESMKMNEAKYDIGMARKGNGITIYNKAEEENGDYKNVALIDNKGKIKYLDKKVPSKIKKQIEAEAKKMMEIKIEGTMKLTDLLNEDVYVKNKETGNVYQVKNANPSKHEPPSKGEVDKAKSEKEPKKDEPKNDGPKVELDKDFDALHTASDIEGEIEKLEGKISDEDYKKMMEKVEDLSFAQMQAEEAEDYDSPEEFEEETGGEYFSSEQIDKMADDLKDEVRQANGTPKEEPKAEPKSEPKRVPLDKNDSYYIKTAVEKRMGPAAFKALSYGDMQKAYNDEMESRGWEKGDDGEWTKPANESSKRKIKESKGNSMKLKDLLKESFEKGKVYSNPFHTPFVKENDMDRDEESNEMTNEQKMAFLEAVKAYKSFGETVYRNEGLAEVYESIKGLVESAGKNMVKETEGSFDGITVGRHVKRMNESFKIFEKTLREVGTLQQRLESTYDEIGEVLGKYYEINELEEGNEFGAARAKAIANGDSEFEVDGKKYPVKGVDKDDKENAKEFANESKSMKLTSMLNESFGYGELPSEKLMKMKVSAKDMLDSVKNKKTKAVIEGYSTEEKRIVLLAVRKLMKYKNIDINLAAQYVVGASQELQMDIDKGKVKK